MNTRMGFLEIAAVPGEVQRVQGAGFQGCGDVEKLWVVAFVLFCFFFFLGGADTHDFREDVCVCMRQR